MKIGKRVDFAARSLFPRERYEIKGLCVGLSTRCSQNQRASRQNAVVIKRAGEGGMIACRAAREQR
jgi:hypothetical protein